MSDLLLIAFASGLQDGLNPCIFMTCAVFIVLGLWLSGGFAGMVWLRILFVLMYGLSLLVFNFGPGQILTYHKGFLLAAKTLYLALGIWAFILGILFFSDWVKLRRGRTVKDLTDNASKTSVARMPMALMTPVLAVVLAGLATLAPVNKYMLLLGNEALLNGQWKQMIPVLLGYTTATMWPLWFVCLFLSIKNLRPSFLKIVCAAIFFTASSCVLLIFS
jgi:hypothetical protein